MRKSYSMVSLLPAWKHLERRKQITLCVVWESFPKRRIQLPDREHEAFAGRILSGEIGHDGATIRDIRDATDQDILSTTIRDIRSATGRDTQTATELTRHLPELPAVHAGKGLVELVQGEGRVLRLHRILRNDTTPWIPQDLEYRGPELPVLFGSGPPRSPPDGDVKDHVDHDVDHLEAHAVSWKSLGTDTCCDPPQVPAAKHHTRPIY